MLDLVLLRLDWSHHEEHSMRDLTHFPLLLPEEFVNSWESSSYKWRSTAKLSKIFTTLSHTQKSKTCDTLYVRVSATQRLSNVFNIYLRQRIRPSSWHSCCLIPNRTRSKRRWVSCDRRYRWSLSDLETSWPTQNQRPSIKWCRCKRNSEIPTLPPWTWMSRTSMISLYFYGHKFRLGFHVKSNWSLRIRWHITNVLELQYVEWIKVKANTPKESSLAISYLMSHNNVIQIIYHLRHILSKFA